MIESLADAVAATSELIRAWQKPCAVIGGAAMVLRVRARPTRDIDIVIAATREDVDDVLEVARDLAWQYDEDPQSRELAEEGLIQLYRPGDRRSSFGVDLICVDGPFLERVVARATPVTIGATTLPVATVEDLLLLKLEAGRGIDVDDAIAIKDAFGPTLDRSYLAEQADAIGVRREIENLLGPLPSG